MRVHIKILSVLILLTSITLLHHAKLEKPNQPEPEPPIVAYSIISAVADKPEPALQAVHIEPAPEVVEAAPAEPEYIPDEEDVTPNYTDEELELMAIVIYQEGGSDSISDDTRLKIGNVVLNRVADERFPDTIYEVLMQKQQYGLFYWTGVVWPDRASNEPEAVERAYECARRVLEGEKLLPDTAVWQAEFRQGRTLEAYQDGIYFCS